MPVLNGLGSVILPSQTAETSKRCGPFMQPDTRYAKSGDVHIAYQVFGEGPLNLVFVPLSCPTLRSIGTNRIWLAGLIAWEPTQRWRYSTSAGPGCRIEVADLPGFDNVSTIYGQSWTPRAWNKRRVFAISEGAPLSAIFAATYPERCRALVLSGGFARFSSWLPTDEAFATFWATSSRLGVRGASLPHFSRPRWRTIQAGNTGGPPRAAWGQPGRCYGAHAHEPPDRY